MVNQQSEVEEICFDYYNLLYTEQPISEEAMTEVLDGLPESFIENTNELTKPFSTLEFFLRLLKLW